ncbi:MAG: Hpt domain-containing protein [Proteobacteria bacterium]|nr:MAG: Hpt domain-containing protein [Pseudomonadota bacterium]
MSNQDPSPSAAPTISPERRAVYLGRRAQDLALLNAAIQEKDFGTIGSIAHKIKGSARLFGFNNLS